MTERDDADVTPAIPPEPLVEAAQDLLVICGEFNVPSQAARILRAQDRTKTAQISWAYSAVAEARSNWPLERSVILTATGWTPSWRPWLR